MRLDAHQHFWNYSPIEHNWMTEEMGSLKRNYLPSDIKPLLVEAGLDGTVAVQARQSLEETDWLLGLAEEYDLIKGVVGWVDLQSPQVGQQLAKYANNPKFKGVRHVVHDEPDDQFMLRSEFLRGLGLLADLNLTYDLLLYPRHLPVAVEVVKQFPRQRFVLDHIAKPSIKAGQLAPWEADIRALARSNNVLCKVSGMVTEAAWKQWTFENFKPYLDVIFDSFGTDRLMFGSDWPVCTVSGTYSEVVGLIRQYLEKFPASIQDKVWGLTAQEFYRITA